MRVCALLEVRAQRSAIRRRGGSQRDNRLEYCPERSPGLSEGVHVSIVCTHEDRTIIKGGRTDDRRSDLIGPALQSVIETDHIEPSILRPDNNLPIADQWGAVHLAARTELPPRSGERRV